MPQSIDPELKTFMILKYGSMYGVLILVLTNGPMFTKQEIAELIAWVNSDDAEVLHQSHIIERICEKYKDIL